jgi:hypothetical protein
MNLAELERKLIAAARTKVTDDRVPFAFEKRVMTRLQSPAGTDELAWWGRALWFGASACAAVTLAVSAWNFSPDAGDSEQASSFSQGVEQSLFASADDPENSW